MENHPPTNCPDKALLNIHLVFPKLPPENDAIGEYTAYLARTLARTCKVSVLTAQKTFNTIPGVSIQTAFSINSTRFAQRHQIRGILDALQTETPDWLILQYNAFSYGRWGLNLYLPGLLKAIKHQYPSVRCAVMAHETWPPPQNCSMVLMSSWQRWQLWQLGRTADIMLFSIQPWADKFQQWFPRTPVYHLPVASNMPSVATERKKLEREQVRRQLGIGEETFVMGVFGQVHHSRLLGYVRAAANAIDRECQTEAWNPEKQPSSSLFQVLYIGSHGSQMARVLEGIPWIDVGRLEAEDVSRYFTAMDLFLSPFKRGVSTRRGSFMTALQQGIATVSTRGVHTDEMLKKLDRKAFVLADDRNVDEFCQLVVNLYRDRQCRENLGNSARQLYETTFEWEALSRRLLTVLQ
jgi:glycosyltransferase involved in cell wall biosynthesis